MSDAPFTLQDAPVSSSPQTFWCYKRGLLVLKLSAAAGPFLPTSAARTADGDVIADADSATCTFASGQFLSAEWEPRVRVLLDRANDLVEFIELLEDRRYAVDLDPPSMKSRPFRFL